MDYLRSCYDCVMVFPGVVDPVPVRWYFTDKDFLPLRHRYASRIWLGDKRIPAPIGEQPSPRTYYNGQGPGPLPCAGPGGSAEAWQGQPGQPLLPVQGFPGKFSGRWKRARRFVITWSTNEHKHSLWWRGRRWTVRTWSPPHYVTTWSRARDWTAIAQTESMHVAAWARARDWTAIPATTGAYAATWARGRTWSSSSATTGEYAAAWERARAFGVDPFFIGAYLPLWERGREWIASEATGATYSATIEHAREWSAEMEVHDNVTSFDCGTQVAAGTTQGTATVLSHDTVTLTSTGANQGVIPPDGCYRICLYNNNSGGGNSIKVYPPSGAKLGPNATDAAITLGAQSRLMIVRFTSTQWGIVSIS